MLSFLKKWFGSGTTVTTTFKERVRTFWVWFEENAERFYSEIEAKRAHGLAEEVSAKVDELLTGFAWVFGPGADGVGHSFTLSGEGDLHKQLLTAFWKSKAPKLRGWTFYSVRQPSRELDGMKMGVRLEDGELEFSAGEFWLTPHVNAETEMVDLVVWHPLFSRIEEKQRWMPLFVFLDEALGEVVTQNWIGSIDLGEHRLAESIPLTELHSYIANVAQETGWKKGEPGELWSAYSLKNPAPGAYREDIVAGTTRVMPLIHDLENGMLTEDPLEGFGAEYVFVAFDAQSLPQEEATERRSHMEEVLDRELMAAGEGTCLGGAHGLQYAYLDLLLWDGQASIETVKRVVRELGVPEGATIEYFAKARKKERVRL